MTTTEEKILKEHRRNVLPGNEYNKYFPKANGTSGLVKRNGNVKDTVHLMGEIVKKTLNDTKQIAKILIDDDELNSCKNIWNFCHTYIQYKLDEPGREQVRRPARSWRDRGQADGIDCDCFSVLVSSILHNMQKLEPKFKLDHCFRVTKYNAGWQHVYVVVNGKETIIIDCVLDKFNYEKPYTDKFDYNMKNHTLGTPLEYLDGIGLNNELEFPVGNEMDLLGAGASEAETLNAQKEHLIKTRNELAKNPTRYILAVGNPKAYIQMIDYVLKNWDDPVKRAEALEIAASNEDELMITLQGTDDDDLLGKRTKAEKEEAKKSRKEGREEAKKANSKEKRKADRKAMKALPKSERKKKRREEQKGLFRGLVRGLTKTANPLIMAARKGFVMALSLNLFGLATRFSKNPSALEKTKNNYVRKMGGTVRRFDLALARGKDKPKLLGEYDDLLGDYDENDIMLGGPEFAALIPAVIPIANALMSLKDDGSATKEETEALSGLGEGEDAKEEFLKKVIKMIKGVLNKKANKDKIANDPDAKTPDAGDDDTDDKADEGDEGDEGGSKTTGTPKWLVPAAIVSVVVVGGGIYMATKK